MCSTMDPPVNVVWTGGAKAPRAPQIPEKMWEYHKPELCRLREFMTLDLVLETVKQTSGFAPTSVLSATTAQVVSNSRIGADNLTISSGSGARPRATREERFTDGARTKIRKLLNSRC